MSHFEIEAEVRTKTGKGIAHQLRAAEKIPAVFYGKGNEPFSLTVNPRTLDKLLAQPSGMNTVIRLKVKDKGEFDALLKDYQAHPISRKFMHADFINIDLTKKIKVNVPLHLVGTAIGVKEGGILEHITREIEVLCLPTNIPTHIDVDVSALNKGDNLHLPEVKLPAGVEALGGAEVTIASIIIPREEEAAAAPTGLVEPEVLTAKKEEGAPAGKDAKPAADAKAAPEAKKDAKK